MEYLVYNVFVQAKQLSYECKLYDRIIYRSKYQHGHSVYYHRMVEVKRCNKWLQSRLRTLFALIQQILKRRDSSGKWSNSDSVIPLIKNLDKQLKEFVIILRKVYVAALKASSFVLNLLTQRHFLSFGITVLSTLSRFFTVYRFLFRYVLKSIRETRALLQVTSFISLTQYLEIDNLQIKLLSSNQIIPISIGLELLLGHPPSQIEAQLMQSDERDFNAPLTENEILEVQYTLKKTSKRIFRSSIDRRKLFRTNYSKTCFRFNFNKSNK